MAVKRTGSDWVVGFAKLVKKSVKWLALFLELLGRPILWFVIGSFIILTYLIRLGFFWGKSFWKVLFNLIFRVFLATLIFFFSTLGFLLLGLVKIFRFLAKLSSSELKKIQSWFKQKLSPSSLVKQTLRLAKTIDKKIQELEDGFKGLQLKKRGKRVLRIFAGWEKTFKKAFALLAKEIGRKIRRGWLVISSFSKSVEKEVKRVGSKKISLGIKRPHFGPILGIFLFFFFLIISLSAWGYFEILKDLPQPEKLINRPQIVSTKIYDRKGNLLYKIYRRQNRTLIKLADIPPALVQATIAIEDAEFYSHHGFSLRAIARSLVKNLRGGKLQGGSTITQQLVKNAFLSPERTLKRKLKELVLSFQAELKFSKEEILQMYLNEVGYGGAAYGAEEASWKYFDKSVRNLNIAEVAFLAGLPASPTIYYPFGSHPELSKERQSLVLKRMVEEGFISPSQAEIEKNRPLQLVPQTQNIGAPHFSMYIREILAKNFGENLVEEGGLEVTTTLDLEIQEFCEKVLREELEKLTKLHISNAAVLVTKPATGEIIAMVGSRDYYDLANDGNVNVTLRPRQPGSAIKPVNYSVALEMGYTLASIISDTPITYKVTGQPPYSPRNYDNKFHGNIALRTALASSYNVPAVKVLSSYGVDKMVRMGQKLGITTWTDFSRFGLSLTLGGGEVKMIDLATVYGTLANLGRRVYPNPVLEITDYQGRSYQLEKTKIDNGGVSDSGGEAEAKAPEDNQVLDPRIAYLLTDVLADNQARTPAFGPYSLLNIEGKTVAVKTGTTNSLRDNWTIGYTPDWLVAVWVGNNDNSPMSYVASGITGASPIWNRIMATLLAGGEDRKFIRPEGIIEVEICPFTGTLPCNGCPVKKELFISGTEPKTHCQIENTVPREETQGEILGEFDVIPKKKHKPEPRVIDYHPPTIGNVIWDNVRR